MTAISVMFRRRATPAERVAESHRSLLAALRDRLAGTPVEFDSDRVYFEGEDEWSGAADLTPALHNDRIQGAISYCPRKAIDADHAMFDDVLTLTMARDEELYSKFVDEVFFQIVDVFDAYRAAVVLDADLDLDDFDQIADISQRSGKDVDGRDGVFRIAPVSALDNELCRRAFSLTAADVVARLQPFAERSWLMRDVACFVMTRRVVSRRELEEASTRALKALQR